MRTSGEVSDENVPALDPVALRRREALMGYGHAVIRTDSNGGRYVAVEAYEQEEQDDPRADFGPVEIDPEII